MIYGTEDIYNKLTLLIVWLDAWFNETSSIYVARLEKRSYNLKLNVESYIF